MSIPLPPRVGGVVVVSTCAVQVTIWKQDKAAWEAERKALMAQVTNSEAQAVAVAVSWLGRC